MTAESAVEIAENSAAVQGSRRALLILHELTAAHGARGVGDRYADVWMGIGQRLDQAALARARGGGNDVQGAAAVGHVGEALLNVLHLFAHLLDQHLEANRGLSAYVDRRLWSLAYWLRG
ncbi:hypothetical protein FQR65_LT20040 [Abscondita terminalis]|nr:hypothetical protein FQR65_LT20040 [Abscondita terminalis]